MYTVCAGIDNYDSSKNVFTEEAVSSLENILGGSSNN